MMRWRSSTCVRWIGWTVLFGLAQAGAIVAFLEVEQPRQGLVFWVLIVGLAVFAFVIGLRLRTPWWGYGPVVAYVVLAAIFMNAEDQSRSNIARSSDYAVVAVIAGAATVMVSSTLAALAGTAWAAVARLRVPGRSRDEFTKRWSRVRRFFTVEDVSES